MSDVTDLDRRGYVHEALLHRNDDELLDAVVPFLEDGLREGEATVAAFGPATTELVRDALDHPDDVRFELREGRHATPAAAIKEYLSLFDSLRDRGARRIRVAGEVPHPADGAPWHAWARYEAAVNRAFAHLPVWGLCAYDLRTTPDDVLRDVRCTHTRLHTSDRRHVRNGQFRDPAAWLADRPAPGAHPLERTRPQVELRDPWPHEARLAVEPIAGHLAPATTADLVTAVSEVVANARTHGAPPVVVRAWAGRDHVVVTIDDAGTGPTDPFVGLLPPDRAIGAGGLGLWIAHQLCEDVALARTHDGFRVRIVSARHEGR